MEPLVIRFIRDSKNYANDDLVCISPLSNNTYQIKTNYSDNNKKYIQTLSYNNVFDYVHSVMILLIHDDAPFVNVQIDMPNTPAVLLAVKDLDSERLYGAIDKLLHITLSSWSRSN